MSEYVETMAGILPPDGCSTPLDGVHSRNVEFRYGSWKTAGKAHQREARGDVKTLTRNDEVLSADTLMRRERIRHVPVLRVDWSNPSSTLARGTSWPPDEVPHPSDAYKPKTR